MGSNVVSHSPLLALTVLYTDGRLTAAVPHAVLRAFTFSNADSHSPERSLTFWNVLSHSPDVLLTFSIIVARLGHSLSQ